MYLKMHYSFENYPRLLLWLLFHIMHFRLNGKFCRWNAKCVRDALFIDEVTIEIRKLVHCNQKPRLWNFSVLEGEFSIDVLNLKVST